MRTSFPFAPASKRATRRLHAITAMMATAAGIATLSWSVAAWWSAQWWIMGPCVALLTVVAFSFAADAYLAQHGQLVLDGGDLRVRTGYLRHFSIPTSLLTPLRAETVDLHRSDDDLRPMWRLNGLSVRGFRRGWFGLRNGEKAWLFVTNPHQVLRLPTTEGYSLLLSVTEPEVLLGVLRQTVASREAATDRPASLKSERQN